MTRFLPSLKRDQWLLFAAFLLWGVGMSTWLHLQPLYIAMLGATPEQVGAAIGLPGILVIFLFLPMGWLADHMGRRKPLIVGSWAVAALAMLLIALAPDWRWVIPGLALFTISNFANPVVAAYLADTEAGGNLARVFAILSAGWSVGNLAGPALGGWIAETWGLRAVLYAATGFSALSTLATLFLSEKPAAPVEPAQRVGVGRLLAARGFVGQIVVLMLIVFALDLGTILSPSFLQDVKGLSVGQIGSLGTVASLGLLATMLLLGRMRPERRAPLLFNQVIVAAGLGLLLAAPDEGHGLAFYLPLGLGFFCRGAAQAAWPVMRGRVAHGLQPQAFNLAFGLMDTALQAARTLAPFVAGLLYARAPGLPLMAGLAALAVTLALTLLLPSGRARQLVEARAGAQ